MLLQSSNSFSIMVGALVYDISAITFFIKSFLLFTRLDWLLFIYPGIWPYCHICNQSFYDRAALEAHWKNSRSHFWYSRCGENVHCTQALTSHKKTSAYHWECTKCSQEDPMKHYHSNFAHNYREHCERDFESPANLQSVKSASQMRKDTIHLPLQFSLDNLFLVFSSFKKKKTTARTHSPPSPPLLHRLRREPPFRNLFGHVHSPGERLQHHDSTVEQIGAWVLSVEALYQPGVLVLSHER